MDLSRIDRNGLLVVVVARPKSTSQNVNQSGFKLISSVDSRISLQIPKQAFEKKTHVSLQAIFCSDSHVNKPMKVSGNSSSSGKSSGNIISGSPKKISLINKNNFNYCNFDANFKRLYSNVHSEFLGISPIIRIKLTSFPVKKLIAKVIQPTGAKKKKRRNYKNNEKNNKVGGNLFFADPEVYKEQNSSQDQKAIDELNKNDSKNNPSNFDESNKKENETFVENNENKRENETKNDSNKKPKDFLILPPIMNADKKEEESGVFIILLMRI